MSGEASRKYRKKMKEEGWVALHIYVPVEIRDELRAYCIHRKNEWIRLKKTPSVS